MARVLPDGEAIPTVRTRPTDERRQAIEDAAAINPPSPDPRQQSTIDLRVINAPPPPGVDERQQNIQARRNVASFTLPLIGDLTAGDSGQDERSQDSTALELLGVGGIGAGLSGATRLTARLARPPGYASRPHTLEWYKWVLSLPQDSADPEYSTLLNSEQVQAADKLREVGVEDPYKWLGGGKFSSGPSRAEEAQADREDKKQWLQTHKEQQAQQYAGQVNVVNAFGEQVDPRKVMNLSGGQKPGVQSDNVVGAYVAQTTAAGAVGQMTAKALGIQQGPVDPRKLMRSGKVVFLGVQKVMTSYGVEVEQPQFMSIDDAALIPAQWSAENLAAFQHANKIKITGLYDEETEKKWAAIVKTANNYATGGVPRPLQDVVQNAITTAARTAGGSGGSGGGGGGGGRGGSASGGAAVSASQARAFLDQTMRQYAGRQANNAEAATFYKDLNAAAMGPNFDPQSWAASWVNTHTGGESGAYQAATSYYAAAMSALGGGKP